MEYTISAADGLLRVRAWARETPQFPLQACTEIIGEMLRAGLTRVLVELQQKVALNSVSQFEMADRMRSLGVGPEHRIALVHLTPGLYEASDMLELAAGNRGLNVKNFRDLPAALAWLG